MQVLKDELRHKILLESEHLFLQRGYDRTSLQMIADKVNISKSNLYHYFKNKEELFYELTGQRCRRPEAHDPALPQHAV